MGIDNFHARYFSIDKPNLSRWILKFLYFDLTLNCQHTNEILTLTLCLNLRHYLINLKGFKYVENN